MAAQGGQRSPAESEDTPKGEINFDEPYLVNFSHSRPDGDVWATDGPSPNHDYQHPEYLVADGPPPRYEKKYDYYCIGIVLLEIGLWRPLVSELKSDGGTSATFRTLLIEKWVPKLRRCMGRRYRSAVKECLEGSHFSETVSADKVSDFYEKVVEPLLEIQI